MCSLQSVSRAFAVYGGQHLYECGFADSVGRACFAGIANLNQWKLRSFIHILSRLVTLQCASILLVYCIYYYHCAMIVLVWPVLCDIK